MFLKVADDLAVKANEIRCDIIKSLTAAASGHLGGSLGLADIFTVLYFNILNHRPDNPLWEDRDRVVLSIGHVVPVLYATLAHSGYFSLDELLTLRKFNSRLQGHPARTHKLPGIELSAGSLGQGLSVAVGMALAAKSDNKEHNIYCILGDGELQEGSVWEAAMSAAHYKLNNIIAIVDRNNCQIDGRVNNVMDIEPLSDKWKSFNWNLLNVDGHNYAELIESFNQAKTNYLKPTVIIAKTLMGKGVKSIEDNYQWHGKVPTADETQKFIKELFSRNSNNISQ